MDERNWASKMGEEGDESGRRWRVSFGGGGEEDDESVRMMDEEVRAWGGWERDESLRAYLRKRKWVWNGKVKLTVKEIEKERNKYYFNESGNKK